MLTNICRSQLNDRNNDFAFFNKDTANVDCNVAMCSEAVELVTGVKMPAIKVRQVGLDMSGGTGTRLARRVFRNAGMVEGTDFIVFNNAPTQTVKDLLKGGWWVVGYIKYDVLRKAAPQVAGSRSYDGAHAIAMADFWRGGGTRRTHYYDPLNDGRKRGEWTAPKGVQAVPFRVVRDALWAYSQTYEGSAEPGFVYGYAVKQRSAQPEPKPPEVEP